MAGGLDNPGDYAWIMASTALVFMMVPGLALFYAGLRSQSTALSLIYLSLMTVALVYLQWFLFGYSLVFTTTSTNGFIGNFANGVFLGTFSPDAFAGIHSSGSPALLFGLFQGMFASFTVALITGVIAEKGRLAPFLVFAFIWTTIVYDPIAYWMWNANGWGNKWGALDWAGGTPVHIASGAASLAYTIVLRHIRKASNTADGEGEKDAAVAESGLASHNNTYALLGTMLVWFGWFGFNAGSELHANMRAASAFMCTNVAACVGGITYTMLERFVAGQKWSGLGFCTGVFTGLIVITPGAGHVPMWASLIFGFTGTVLIYSIQSSQRLKRYLEEPLDISILHGAGGLWGMFLTGIFADQKVAAIDDPSEKGGAINGNAKQIGIQFASGFAAFFYSFVVTMIILVIIHCLSAYFPTLKLRASPLPNQNYIRLDAQELEDPDAYMITCNHPGSHSRNVSISPPQTSSQEGRVPPAFYEMDTIRRPAVQATIEDIRPDTPQPREARQSHMSEHSSTVERTVS